MSAVLLPALNVHACGLSAFLVTTGWLAVRRQQEQTHVLCMILATVASVAFMVGDGALFGRLVATVRAYPVPLGWACAGLLISHFISAALLPVLVTASYVPVWQGQWNIHRRVGKLTLPVWLFASLTGVVVNGMLLYGRGRFVG